MRHVVALLVVGLINPVVCAAAEPMGRLFFTPDQRNALDVGKYAGSAPVKPGPKIVHLDGVVTRSDADRTVWINGKAYHGGSPDGVQVRTNRSTPASTSIGIAGKTAPARVKVGQRLDLNSGKVQEDFSRRTTASENSAPAEKPAQPEAVAKKSTPSEEHAPPVRENAKATRKGDGVDGPTPAR